jgi:hypothetical protein
MSEKLQKEILPSQGFWTVESLALYLGLPASGVQQKLTDLGVKVVIFSSRYSHRIFRLEDLIPVEEGIVKHKEKLEEPDQSQD